MDKKTFQLLTEFKKTRQGAHALKTLLDELEKPRTASATVCAENDFLIVAAHLTGERPSQEQFITGSEEKAHRLLHILLNEDKAGTLKTLKKTLNL